jgi:hypothetical protein
VLSFSAILEMPVDTVCSRLFVDGNVVRSAQAIGGCGAQQKTNEKRGVD